MISIGERFIELCRYADYADGYISINIPDRNLYLDIKNVIDESGGFVETTLTQNLLRISEKYFILLLLKAIEDYEPENYTELGKLIKQYCPEEIQDELEHLISKEETDYTWKDVIMSIGADAAVDLITEFTPVGEETLNSAITHVRKKIEFDRKRNSKK